MLKTGSKGLQFVFTPRHLHARIAIHSAATVTGAAVAVRMGWGAPMWLGMLWYFGGFVAFHVVFAPFMAMWYMATDRIARWVRGIVEEELTRWDLKSYERQLLRVFPSLAKTPDEKPPEPEP